MEYSRFEKIHNANLTAKNAAWEVYRNMVSVHGSNHADSVAALDAFRLLQKVQSSYENLGFTAWGFIAPIAPNPPVITPAFRILTVVE
jgi:hypothetical protein